MRKPTKIGFAVIGFAALVLLLLGQEPVSAGGAGAQNPPQPMGNAGALKNSKTKQFKRYKADDPDNPVTGIEAQKNAKAKDASKQQQQQEAIQQQEKTIAKQKAMDQKGKTTAAAEVLGPRRRPPLPRRRTKAIATWASLIL